MMCNPIASIDQACYCSTHVFVKKGGRAVKVSQDPFLFQKEQVLFIHTFHTYPKKYLSKKETLLQKKNIHIYIYTPKSIYPKIYETSPKKRHTKHTQKNPQLQKPPMIKFALQPSSPSCAAGIIFSHTLSARIRPCLGWEVEMGVEPKIGGKNPKIDGENNGKPY